MEPGVSCMWIITWNLPWVEEAVLALSVERCLESSLLRNELAADCLSRSLGPWSLHLTQVPEGAC